MSGNSFTRHQFTRSWLALALVAGWATASIAQGLDPEDLDPQNFVIENVYIASVGAEEVLINLLVQDNKLKLITKDAIPIPEGTAAFDGNEGYIVGNLALDEPPNFMVLDGDPRVDFEILLDVDNRAVFAIANGDVRFNRLQFAADAHDPRARNRGWHAYAPPPVALPTNYGFSGAWNHWTTENTKGVFWGIIALDRQFWLTQNVQNRLLVGNLEEYEGGEIRDLRFGVFGTFGSSPRPWGYYVGIATNSFEKDYEQGDEQNFRAIDYRLDIPIGEDLRMSVGKQKPPISMERMMSLVDLPMQERTSGSSLLFARDFGVLLSGNAADDRIAWAGGVFSRFIDTDQSISDAEASFVGRVSGLPYISDNQRHLFHLGAAMRVSNGKDGYSFRSPPEFDKSPVYVNTGLSDADRINQYNLEASWRTGPVWLHGEYTTARVDSPTDGDLSFNGYHITGSWIVTGEIRDYRFKGGTLGGVPVSRSVHQNGPGALELAARWSSIDLTDRGIDGGKMQIASAGVNWWLSTNFEVNLNYRYIVTDRSSLEGTSSGAMLRVILKLN